MTDDTWKEGTWIFKVLDGLPPSETTFHVFNDLKIFSARLSDLYPNIVTTYEKVE